MFEKTQLSSGGDSRSVQLPSEEELKFIRENSTPLRRNFNFSERTQLPSERVFTFFREKSTTLRRGVKIENSALLRRGLRSFQLPSGGELKFIRENSTPLRRVLKVRSSTLRRGVEICSRKLNSPPEGTQGAFKYPPKGSLNLFEKTQLLSGGNFNFSERTQLPSEREFTFFREKSTALRRGVEICSRKLNSSPEGTQGPFNCPPKGS